MGGAFGHNLVRAAAVFLVLAWLAVLTFSTLVTLRTGDDGLALQLNSFAPRAVGPPTEPVLIAGVTPGSPAAEAGVRPGDLLVAVDGVPAGDTGALRDLIYRRPTGTRTTLRVISQDTRQARDVPLTLVARWTQPGAASLVIAYGLSGLFTLAVVVPLALARPADLAARVLLLAGGSGALWQALDASFGNLRERWLPLGWDIVDQLGYLIALVNALAFLHLFLIFPGGLAAVGRDHRDQPGPRLAFRPSFLRTAPALIALYLLPIGAALVVFLLHLSAVSFLWAIVGATLAATAATIVHGYIRPVSPLARAQLRWVGAAACVIAFALVAGPIVQVITGGRVYIVGWLTNVASFALIYLAIALAVLRYRLFDVHVVLRATLVYPLLLVVLLGGYYAIVSALGWSAALLLGSQEAGARFADASSTRGLLGLFAAAAFQPLRAWLLRIVDQLLYPERRALERFFAETVDALTRARPIEDVEILLTRDAAARLDLDGAWLIRALSVPTGSIAGDMTGALGALTRVVSAAGTSTAGSSTPSAYAAAALLVRLRREPSLLLISPFDLVRAPVPTLSTEAPGATDLAEWYAAGARLLVPLRVQDELVGVWALGQRRSFALPDRADLSAVARIAAQAAVLLDYARLHETHLSAQLAAQRQALDAERVRALEQLNRAVQQERATLAALMESMRDGLVVADAAGAIRYCNARAGALLGSTAAGGESVEAYVGGALRDALHRASATPTPLAAPTGYTAPTAWPPRDAVDEVTLPGPPRRDLRLEWFPVGESGVQLGYGLLLRDVTEERSLERAKDEFTSMLSHELRSPIGVIKGFAATLLQAAGELTDAERGDSLRFVEQASDQLLDLVNNLLDLSRISAGTFTVDPQPARLDALVENTSHQMVEARGSHRLALALAPDLPLVLADTARVEQVLRNLLDNAMKYSPAGTTVRVGAALQGGEIVVTVDDEGGGVAPDDLERLFERYQRGQGARTRNVAGAGLGLAISRHLVHAHHGRIWAESPVPGRDQSFAPGTRFTFTLPVALDVSSPAAPTLPTAAAAAAAVASPN